MERNTLLPPSEVAATVTRVAMDAGAAGSAVFAFQGPLGRVPRPPGPRPATRATELLRVACCLERLTTLQAHRRLGAGEPAASPEPLETPVAGNPLDHLSAPVHVLEKTPAFPAIESRSRHCGQFWPANANAGRKKFLDERGVWGRLVKKTPAVQPTLTTSRCDRLGSRDQSGAPS
jgi:hypothetical protein